MTQRHTKNKHARQGAVLILIAVLLPVFALMAAYAVDVAWMQLVRTELRTATDAAARAGAKTLSIEQDLPLARAAAQRAARENLVAGEPLELAAKDVQFGLSAEDRATGRFQFSAGGTPTNAVHVDGLRTAGSASGPVGLFFGGLLGVESFEPVQSATSTVLDRDICLVIDRSGSMGLPVTSAGGGNGQNCGPLDDDTRFAALNQAVAAFLDELDSTLPEEQVALVSYSSANTINCGPGRGGRGRGPNSTTIEFETADTRQPLTADYSAIRNEMQDFMENGIGGSTAIGEGLREGLRAFDDPNARPLAIKTVVLMTDGIHNHGIEPIIPARQAAAEDIVVHTVTFSRGADKTRMQAVAAAAGGKHFHADTTADLREVFREIARTLPVLLTE